MWRLRHAWDVIVCAVRGHDWKATDFQHFSVSHICNRCQKWARNG